MWQIITKAAIWLTGLSTFVGAASSRDYCNSTVLPFFIAAGSRSHQVSAEFLQ